MIYSGESVCTHVDVLEHPPPPSANLLIINVFNQNTRVNMNQMWFISQQLITIQTHQDVHLMLIEITMRSLIFHWILLKNSFKYLHTSIIKYEWTFKCLPNTYYLIFRKILSKNWGMIDGCQINNDLLQRNMIHFPFCSVGLIEDG